MSIITKVLPSVEKCFLDETIEQKPALTNVSMLANERLSFQLAYTCDDISESPKLYASLSVESPLAEYVKISKIELVPVALAAYPQSHDDNYLRTAPGLYPDLLIPYKPGDVLAVAYGQLRSVLVTIENTDGIAPGEYPVELTVTAGDKSSTSCVNVKVVDAMLPPQTLIHTQWFHNDCLATYYDTDIFSERHWEIIGNYMKAARRCGINMILTPVLTPPLDTAVGHERPTVQLVDITVHEGTSGESRYSFGYDKLDHYVQLALDAGMEYFEISHLFSQWGAIHAPKVMATVISGGVSEYRRIFGWDTDSNGDEYRGFIREFTAGLIAHMKELGLDKRCWFHISDEPSLEQLESYTKAKSIVADLLCGYKCMDALSSYEFYETGACGTPIPANNHITPFLEHNVPDLWTYYCCGQNKDVSNRFVAMPGQRTRILGAQLYKYDIKGFLQWGFNFWYSQGSLHTLNPFTDTCGDYFVPSGDTMSVYPGEGGKALYSLHAVHFYEALQDMRALQLLGEKLGRDAVVSLIDEDCDVPMTFASYPHSQEYLLSLRERVNSLL